MIEVNDTISFNISASIDTIAADKCCVYFHASAIKVNGIEQCPGETTCTHALLELN